MTVFYCAACAATLTGDLVGLADVPEVGVDDVERDRDKKTGQARSTVPRGYFAIDREPWGAPFIAVGTSNRPARGTGRELLRTGTGGTVSAGRRDSIVVHPDDVLPRLEPFTSGDNWAGCCGPTGAHGPNLACGCGSRLATWAADCIGPNELHLDPVRTYAWHQDGPVERT
ncbi:hypothetical protein [Streptacidiphilus jiangxiensis]|uniref:Uncharacterized protein n=1 Tax=Streptacidiphilus jiangxiensis TaxID=235985 RepID=A0A1H7QX88_STRJI|nr:hypothetical protein [Streptacidiphilus jiangxiensis]SEL52596.1 hypothetical protein SAMN05414137_109267 [Streptacidiphilus jiangxiensis]